MATSLSVSTARHSRSVGCGLTIFFLLFFTAGAVTFYFFAIRPLWGVAAAGSWLETPCKIISSEVGKHRGDDGPTYSIDIKYRYVVDNQQYTADRYDFMSGFNSSGRTSKQKVVDQYPVGKTSVCFVDPNNPEAAVLNRSFTWSMLWGLFPLPFLAVGIGGLIYTIRSSRNAKRQDRSSPLLSAANSAIINKGVPDDACFIDSGPTELKAQSSPGVMFLVSLGAATFWNGIVSLFLFAGDNKGWFETLFMVPFVLVGIALIGWTIYNFAAMFNPRPKLTLSHSSVPSGGYVELQWEFQGSTNSIQRLKIVLKAEERATYVRGTDTTTDTETFYEECLLDASGMQPEISQGSVEFSIPMNTMHSFKSKNNAIEWSINVHGDIPLRPDVKMQFPFTVRPHDDAN